MEGEGEDMRPWLSRTSLRLGRAGSGAKHSWVRNGSEKEKPGLQGNTETFPQHKRNRDQPTVHRAAAPDRCCHEPELTRPGPSLCCLAPHRHRPT